MWDYTGYMLYYISDQNPLKLFEDRDNNKEEASLTLTLFQLPIS